MSKSSSFLKEFYFELWLKGKPSVLGFYIEILGFSQKCIKQRTVRVLHGIFLNIILLSFIITGVSSKVYIPVPRLWIHDPDQEKWLIKDHDQKVVNKNE